MRNQRPNNRNQNQRNTRKKQVSNINPKHLIKKASPIEEVKYTSTRDYTDFELLPLLQENIAKKGYEKPTEIQDKAIASLIEGKNMIGIAATGTGKTAAFLIPIIQQLLNSKGKQALIVVPTRELALQVEEEFRSLVRNTNLKSSCFIGGTHVGKDIKKAKLRNDVVVGTPGRLNDLINRNALKISQTTHLVLDEFDRMLDMGFIHDIRFILSKLQNRKQTMLFSATVDKTQESIIKSIIKDPIRVNVTTGLKSSDRVEQDIIKVAPNENKMDILANMLKNESMEKVILFAETKRTVDKISKQLLKTGIKTDVIHGNKSQNYRAKALSKFKKGHINVLIATDVAARGIDVENVSHVINFQLPLTMDSYIHRIGRTGRAGKTGIAYTFVD